MHKKTIIQIMIKRGSNGMQAKGLELRTDLMEGVLGKGKSNYNKICTLFDFNNL